MRRRAIRTSTPLGSSSHSFSLATPSNVHHQHTTKSSLNLHAAETFTHRQHGKLTVFTAEAAASAAVSAAAVLAPAVLAAAAAASSSTAKAEAEAAGDRPALVSRLAAIRLSELGGI